MHRSVCRLLAAAFAIAGCRHTNPSRLVQNAASETLVFAMGPVDPPPHSYVGHIVATNSLNTNRIVRALVMGSVNNPGWVSAPGGTTALGAIKLAGGFVSFGASGDLRIFRGKITYLYMLATESLGPELPDHYRIWYGPYEWSEMRQRNIVDRRRRSDVILEDGDKVLVPGVL